MKSTKENILEFYEEIKQEFDLPLEVIKDICYSPFSLVRETIKNNTLKNVRLPYFGVFNVSEFFVKKKEEINEARYKEGKITDKLYKERKDMYNNFNELQNAKNKRY